MKLTLYISYVYMKLPPMAMNKSLVAVIYTISYTGYAPFLVSATVKSILVF
jgi:hypothetical protein